MTDHEERADELEREADRLEEASDAVGRRIDETRADFHRKQGDIGVPGADPEDHVLAEGDEDSDEDDDEDG